MFQDGGRLAYAGRVLRLIAREEIEGLAGKIRWEILEVRKERTFREVALNETMLLALAPGTDGKRRTVGSGTRMGSLFFGGVTPAWRVHALAIKGG